MYIHSSLLSHRLVHQMPNKRYDYLFSIRYNILICEADELFHVP